MMCDRLIPGVAPGTGSLEDIAADFERQATCPHAPVSAGKMALLCLACGGLCSAGPALVRKIQVGDVVQSVPWEVIAIHGDRFELAAGDVTDSVAGMHVRDERRYRRVPSEAERAEVRPAELGHDLGAMVEALRAARAYLGESECRDDHVGHAGECARRCLAARALRVQIDAALGEADRG